MSQLLLSSASKMLPGHRVNPIHEKRFIDELFEAVNKATAGHMIESENIEKYVEKLREEIGRYYVFYTTEDNNNVYERTCGTEERAMERVKELKKIYADATYFKNDIPKDYKYFTKKPTMKNYEKVTHSVYSVENQNGFNNALYDYFNANDDGTNNAFSKKEVRKMIQNFPEKYPTSIVIIDQTFECNRIYIETFDIEECFKQKK